MNYRKKEAPGGGNRKGAGKYQHTDCNNPADLLQLDFKEINNAALSSDLPISWYPNARRYGQSLRVGNISGDKGESLWICLRTGAWKDHATGDSGGDLISLYAAREDIGQGEAKRHIAAKLGLKINHHRNVQSSLPKNNHYAGKIWREAKNAKNSPVQAYLKGRGLFNLPVSLRYHPAIPHKPTGRSHAAMVAAITRWPDRLPHAIHRTYLEDGRKAAVKPNRMMLGNIDGGAVRLGFVHKIMALAEGIETGLAFQQLTGIPTWAVLSASNFCGLVLPDTIQEITIAADNDENGRGMKAAVEAAELWASMGKRVCVICPPVPGQDYNDLLIGG